MTTIHGGESELIRRVRRDLATSIVRPARGAVKCLCPLELTGYNAEKLSMAFDDQLKRVFEAAMAELTALSAADREDARREGLEKGRALGWEDGREQGRFEARQAADEEARAAIEAGLAAARAEAASSEAASERLVDAVRAIDRSRSLSEILDTLVSCAARETARAAVLLVRGDRLHLFRAVGLDGVVQDLPLDQSGLIGSAVHTRAAAAGGADGEPKAPPFASLEAGHACLAVPLSLANEVVAVLYADDKNAAASPGAKSWPEALEILARHASKCLEALTALKAARVLTGASAAERGNGSAADAEDPDTSAKRYAKLLVSEIKLYHEPAVVAGQRERDLGARLGGEIARARVLYEQRVPAAVRQRSDYFRDELIRTLANGDPTLLQLT